MNLGIRSCLVLRLVCHFSMTNSERNVSSNYIPAAQMWVCWRKLPQPIKSVNSPQQILNMLNKGYEAKLNCQKCWICAFSSGLFTNSVRMRQSHESLILPKPPALTLPVLLVVGRGVIQSIKLLTSLGAGLCCAHLWSSSSLTPLYSTGLAFKIYTVIVVKTWLYTVIVVKTWLYTVIMVNSWLYTKTLAADPLSPVSWEVGPPWIPLVCPAHPPDARLDCDLESCEAKSTPWTVVLLKPFLYHVCFVAGGHYPAERCHCHQGIPFPWTRVHGLQQSLGRWYMSIITSTWIAGPTGYQKNIDQSITAFAILPSSPVRPGTMCSPSKQRPHTCPSTWLVRPGHFLPSLRGPVLMLTCPL